METKTCTRCGETLEISLFHFVKSRDRYAARCKQCEKIQRRKYIKSHETARRRHNFTEEQYSEIMSKAGEGCEICGQDMSSKVCFDHDHETLKFRGLLCHSCNTALGLFGDNISTLEQAILYLNKHD